MAETARCPICKSSVEIEFSRQLPEGFSWWHCNACDLRFSWPMRSGDSAYYANIWCYARELEAKRAPRLGTVARTWDYRAILEYNRSEGERLLDIGCGAGHFLNLAQKRYGYDVVGIDFNPGSVATARRLYSLENVVCGTWPEASATIPEGSFDRVTLLHVVEHLEDPVASIRTAARALRAEGLLAFAVPTYRRHPELFAGERDLPPHHLTLWSERAIESVLTAAGLEPLWIARAPFVPENLLTAVQERFLPLKTPFLSRVVWVAGRRMLEPPVAVVRQLMPTMGFSAVGIAKMHSSRPVDGQVASATEGENGHRH